MPVTGRALAPPETRDTGSAGVGPGSAGVERSGPVGVDGPVAAGIDRVLVAGDDLLPYGVATLHANGYRLTRIDASRDPSNVHTYTCAARRGGFTPPPIVEPAFHPRRLPYTVHRYERAGYRLVQLETAGTTSWGPGIACTALFYPAHVAPGPGHGWDYTFYTNESYENHQELFDYFTGTMFRPVSVSVETNLQTGDLSYTALYVEHGGWTRLKSRLTPDDYEAEVATYGYPAFLKAYRHDSETFLCAIWDSLANPHRTGLSGAHVYQLRAYDETLDANGYDPVAVTRYVADGDERFYAVWERRGTPRRVPDLDLDLGTDW